MENTRDRHKQLTEHTNKVNREKKTLELTKVLRTEVEIGATGTQRYRIKKELLQTWKDLIQLLIMVQMMLVYQQ